MKGRKPKFKMWHRVKIDGGEYGFIVSHEIRNNHSWYGVLTVHNSTAARIYEYPSAALSKAARVSRWPYHRTVEWNESIADRQCECHCCPHVAEWDEIK